MMTHYTIGVDISKAHIDVYRLPDGKTERFGNNKKGHTTFIRWLKGLSITRIVYEPTGKYHFGFEKVLSDHGFALCKVNPLHGRRFAQAIGVRAKTDKVDARVLAMMGESLQLEPASIVGKTLRELKELQIARQALIKDRTAAKNRSKIQGLALLKQQYAKRLKQIEKDIAAIEAAMMEIIAGEAQLARMFGIICSIPGISAITAMALIVELPELGTLASKQAASLAGLAPFTRQSGQWKGKAFIGAGRKFLREALYMPALVATRYNKDMKAIYQRHITNGKAPKLAITAIMRKLIILANTLVKQDRMWQEKTT